MDADETTYSKIIEGDRGNYKWGVRFDINGNGYLGVSQVEDGKVKDRLLLSPAQVSELVAFVKRHSR